MKPLMPKAIFLTILLVLSVPSVVNAQESSPDESAQNRFLEPNTWWNFYCDSEEDPLLNRTIRAIKIVETSASRPSWVKITFPSSRDEHSSIFEPATQASEDEGLSLGDALAEWEKGISEWETMWINLRYVTRITKVEQDGQKKPLKVNFSIK